MRLGLELGAARGRGKGEAELTLNVVGGLDKSDTLQGTSGDSTSTVLVSLSAPRDPASGSGAVSATERVGEE